MCVSPAIPRDTSTASTADCRLLDYSLVNHAPYTLGPSPLQSTEPDLHPAMASEASANTAPGVMVQDATSGCGPLFGILGELTTRPGVGDPDACLLPVIDEGVDTAPVLDYMWDDLIDMGPATGQPSHKTTDSSPDNTHICSPSCSCMSAGTCAYCKLKQRAARLEAENEFLRAARERMRAARERMRIVMIRHDRVLRDLHDGRRAPEVVIEELWRYQDELEEAHFLV